MLNIPENINENLWELNSHMTIVKPYSLLFNSDKSKNKHTSSKILWCIIWMSHPDEDKNKFYRIKEDERLDLCKEFEPSFNKDNEVIKECIERFPELCLTLIEQSYKQEKDQLAKITRFLNSQEISFDNAESLIKLKSSMPKLYADFAKTDKEFERTKSQQRVFGGRQKTQREKNVFKPED